MTIFCYFISLYKTGIESRKFWQLKKLLKSILVSKVILSWKFYLATYSSPRIGLVVWSTRCCWCCCCWTRGGGGSMRSSSIELKNSDLLKCFSSSARSVNMAEGRIGAFGRSALGSAGLAGRATTSRTWLPVPRRTAATRSLPTPWSQCSFIWKSWNRKLSFVV